MTKIRHIKTMDRAASALAILAICAMAWDIALAAGAHFTPIALGSLAAYAAVVALRWLTVRAELRRRAPIHAARSALSRQTQTRLLAAGMARTAGSGLSLPTVATSPYLNRPLRELHEVEAG